MSAEAVFSLKGVTLCLAGQVPLFTELSLQVFTGETFGILGPSGVGKSCLLRLLVGLFVPQQGVIKRPPTGLAMAFQRGALFDSMTAEENIFFVLRETTRLSRPEQRQRVQAILTAVGLEGQGHKRPAELSGGMQKRLALARALVVEPTALVLDEPTAGLDPITSRSILQLLTELDREGERTVILASSDPKVLMPLCDRIALLWKGQVVEVASPKALRTSPNPVTQQFLSGRREGPMSLGGEA